MSVDCLFATCDIVPSLDPDDRMPVEALRRRGLNVTTAIWNDPQVDWGAARLCLVRSTWDYHHSYGEFIAWIERVSARTVLKNDPAILRWNAHKSYLRDLELCGVPVVPTVWAQRGERHRLAEVRAARGWTELVLKPARGAAGHNVMHVRADGASLEAGQRLLDALLQSEDVLVQPFLDSVTRYGERALIFIGGRYSHAVVKKAFDKSLVVGDEPSMLVAPTGEEMSVARRALAAIPGDVLYARIDLINDADGHPHVSELELIEPGLYFAVHEPASEAFADVVERELAA